MPDSSLQENKERNGKVLNGNTLENTLKLDTDNLEEEVGASLVRKLSLDLIYRLNVRKECFIGEERVR